MKNINSSLGYILLSFLFLFFISDSLSQVKKNTGKELILNGNEYSYQTIPEVNSSGNDLLSEHLKGIPGIQSEKFVLGGNLLWSAYDTDAMSTTVKVNQDGSVPAVAWTLNSMRVSLYPPTSSTPLWEFSTLPYDATVALSADGSVIAVTKAQSFYLLNKNTGNIDYELTLPDSLYAVAAAVTRDGQRVVFVANASGGSATARAYCLNLSGGTPVIAWTYDVPASLITNWTGVTISASGNHVVLTARHHIYVMNTLSGNLIWENFLDNTEAPSGISSDGRVIVTADNSGFIQTRLFNATTNEYNLLWQYRVPAGAYTNWASSVAISADGNVILAGSLLFLTGGYDGSIIAFDTYGNGMPKWVLPNAGDLVDDIAISDDGKVAAAVTWGDMAHSRPDLFVFDVQTGQVTYSEVTPGSFYSVDLSPDGKKVIAGGKGVHAREFGMGGRVYFSEINLGGGNVSGTIDLSGTNNDSGVLVKAVGTIRTAVTDQNGNYLLSNLPAGVYTIQAEKPGYNFGSVANVTVTEGNTTAGINLVLNAFPGNAPAVSASNGLLNKIVLNWTGLLSPERKKEIARIVGDEYSPSVFDLNNRIAVSSAKDKFETTDNLLLVDSIAVYRSLASGGPYIKIATVNSSINSYIDSAVFPLKNYYYVINRFNETGQTVYSNEALGKVSDSLLTFSLSAPQSPNVPTIDGIINPAEWADAFKVDISDVFGYSGGTPKPQGSVFMYLKFSQETKMLYVAGEDFLNTSLDNNEGFGFYLDDNNNDKFEAPDALPVYQEGNIWAYWHPEGALVRFRQIFTNGGVGLVDTLFNAPVAFTDGAGHVQGEFAIPMGFLNGNELQVYAPDKIVGLGAFLIARDGGAALFNGWWPQTMNSVFNPQYFGDININVLLNAPPQPPSNLSVLQQGEKIKIIWTDPVLGLNNDPLPVPPFINIYKNNEYLTTVPAGVGSYTDSIVYCKRWYEYQTEAFVIVGADTFFSPRSNPAGEFSCESPALTSIKYDDGGWEAFYVVDFTYFENKFALRFTPTFYPARVLRMEALVNDKKGFEYTINADSSGYPGKVIAGPFMAASVSSAQVSNAVFTVPGDQPPVMESSDDFWILINYLPSSPGAPGIGVDFSQPNSGRGMYYTSSSGWVQFPAGNLMITAYIADPAPPPPLGIDENSAAAPLTYQLMQNYPNPFNPSTVIRYQVPENEMVTLEVYNALGQKVRTLVNEIKEPGQYSISWDGITSSGNSASTGIYFCRIQAGKFNDVKKMMLMK
jgi:hypothetical protein